MKIYSLIIVFILLVLKTTAEDSLHSFLVQVNSNNKRIAASEKLMSANGLEAYQGIYLENPAVEYEQVGGKGAVSSELTVSQSFDFPSVYTRRKSIANLSKEQSSFAFRQVKREVLSDAVKVYIEQVYLNRKKDFYMDLKDILDTISINVEKSFQLGAIDVIKANRIRSEAVRNKVNISELETQCENNAFTIRVVNGGLELFVEARDYPLLEMPQDKDSLKDALLKNHPQDEYWKAEVEKSGEQVRLMKAVGLPGFELGYKQESGSAIGSTEFGFVAGLTIPLFENKNKVKHAIAQKSYIENEYLSASMELENEVAILVNNYYSSLQSLQYTNELEQSLNAVTLLWKAYNSGQIGYTEFFESYGNYCEMFDYIENVRKQVYTNMLQLYVYLNY